MPARSSRAEERIFEIRPWGKYSARKIEIERENGIEINNEITEVKRVPATKGKAPNSPDTGSQTVLLKNFNPNLEIEGIEDKKRVKNIENKSKIKANPQTFNIYLKTNESRFSLLKYLIFNPSFINTHSNKNSLNMLNQLYKIKVKKLLILC